jgi:hypothetical protein
MLFIRPRSLKNNRGYILVGALALAVIVAVAASMAILSSQQKVDEERNKEANINARLAMDSQASRILTLIDRGMESNGTYASDNVLSVPLGDVTSGPYQVSTMQILDTGVQLGPYAMYYQPLLFQSLDPLFSDVRMNTQQFRVQINANTQNPAYSNYIGTYTFQVRAVPIADFGVFNPGAQPETITLGNHGDITDGTTHQTNAWAYIGNLQGAFLQSPGSYGPLNIINAIQTAGNPNTRLYRQLADVAKWVNGPSSGFGTFLGRYDNLTESYASLNDACTTYGMMYDTGQGIAGEADTIDTFLSIAQSILGSPPPQPYQITQVTSGNPLYSTDNQGYVATMDFGAVNSCTPALTGPVDRIVLLGMPAATNVNGTNISINTIVVTNAGYIASPSLDVSFPPNINVFFADNVNTNASQLRVEGNIGFIPLADTNITSATNSNPAGRSLNSVYTNSTAPFTIIRPAILVDVTNQIFIYTTNYLALESQLLTWATNIQVQLLSNPAGDWYITNAGLVNYLIPQIRLYRLNESCAPIVAFQSDWATNVLVGLHTNTFNEYSFGGYTLDDGPCGSGDPGGYYVLNGDNIMLSPQNMLPTNLTVISPSSPLTLTEMLVNGNTNSMSASFTNPVLAQLHNDITDPVAGTYIDYGYLYTWMPSNVPASTLGAALLAPSGDPLQGPYFAMAWITIEPAQTYDEQFRENYQLAQSTGQTAVIATTAAAPFGFSMTNTNSAGEFWYDYLQDSWIANVTDPETPAYGSFRFDASGNFNPNDSGAWKMTSSSITQDQYDYSQTASRDETDLSTNDYAEFYQRQIVFHYQTMGWTITNLTVINGQAPAFYGRLVVEDGINRLLTLNPTNLIVHGQVTYNHRIKSATEPVPANVLSIGAYTVDHTQTTYQTNSAERIYDARILRVDTHRN